MSFKIDFFLLFTCASIFSHNNAAFFQEIVNDSESFSEYHSRLRDDNMHRGVLLSKTSQEQNKVCGDILSSQYFQNKRIVFADKDLQLMRMESGLARSDESIDPIAVRKMTSNGKVVAEEVFLTCQGMRGGTAIPLITIPIFISSAFEIKMFHTSQKNIRSGHLEVEEDYDVSTSPTNVPLDQFAVEELYINTYQNIDVLRQESPRYVEMIEARDDIQALSHDGRLTICGSIFGSDGYRDQNLAIDLAWLGSSEESDIIDHQPIRIWNENYMDYEVSSDNVLCRAFNTVHLDKTDFYYTRSYNNRNSVFFIEKHDSNIREEVYFDFDAYLEDIPVLINARKKSRTSIDLRSLAEKWQIAKKEKMAKHVAKIL